MLNFIQERRVRQENGYDLYLEIPEDEYYHAYNGINEAAAENILALFLRYHQDDGRIESIEIRHDKNNHSVNIHAFLNYEDNTHTDAVPTPNHLRENQPIRRH